MPQRASEIERAWRMTNNVVSPFLSPKEDKEQAEAFLEEPRLFMENFLYIQNKDAELVLFKFKRIQQITYDLVQRIRHKMRKPVRILNEKSRRCGFSTWVSAYLFTLFRFTRNFEMRLASLSNESSDNLFNMYTRYLDMLPDEMRPPLLRRKAGKLLQLGNKDPKTCYKYPGIQSILRTGTAKNPNLGRSEGNRALHLSEAAFWDDSEDTLRAVLRTVPDRPDTFIFQETTSNGMGGNFYDEFMRARSKLKAGTWDWYPLFLPSWMDEDCKAKLSFQSCAERDPDLRQDPDRWKEEASPSEREYLNTLDDYEWSMVRKFTSVGLPYIEWRRREISENCKGNKAIFDMENAPTLAEAFVAQGQSVFTPQSLEYYMKTTMRQGRVGRLVVPPHRPGQKPRPYFVDDPEGHLTVWEMPRKELRYAIGADASMGQRGAESQAAGTEYEGEGADSDYCAALVLGDTHHQVAELRTRMIDPETFAEEVAALGYWYNEAWVMPEVGIQGAGIALMYKLKEIYHHIGRWETVDSVKVGKKKEALGWEANAKTKAILLGKAVRQVLHGAGQLFSTVSPSLAKAPRLVLRSRELLKEMASFAVTKSGSFGARHGAHDDLVIALCMGLLMLKDLTKGRYISPANRDKVEKALQTQYTGGVGPLPRLRERSWTEL